MEIIQHMLPIEIWTKIFDYSNRETINNTLLFMVLNERKSKNKYITEHSRYIILKNYRQNNSFLTLYRNNTTDFVIFSKTKLILNKFYMI